MTDYNGTDNLEVMADAVNYNKYLINLVLDQTKTGDRIIDFGAGIGTFSQQIIEYGHKVSCVEPDLKQASVIAESGTTVYRDLAEIDDNSIDYLYTLNVLEHIEDDNAILNEIYKKLKPGGRLLIYVPAFQILYSSMDRKVGHFRRYTIKSLTDIAHNAGFDITKKRYADSVGFLATILYKLIGDSSGAVNVDALIIYDRLIFPFSRLMDKFLGAYIGKNVLLVAKKKTYEAI